MLLPHRERFAAIVELATDAIIVIDDDGRIGLFNAAAERLFGCSEQDAIGTHLERLILPRLHARYRAGMDRWRQSHAQVRDVGVRSVWWGVRTTGEKFPCEVSIAQYPVGEAQEFMISVRDITERRQSAKAIRHRVEFERFLFDLSSAFIAIPEESIDANMEQGLARVGAFLDMDRVTLMELSHDRAGMVVAYSWHRSGVTNPPPIITNQMQPWWLRQVLRGDVSLASRVDDLPQEAAAEKEYFRQRGITSAGSIPLKVSGEIAGAISFATVHRRVSWTPELVNQLRAIGDVFWNALKRRQAMQTLRAARETARENEERFRLVMNNVAAGVYTLDLDGMVTYVNPAAEAMFGWTNAELVGRKMHDATHYKHPDGTAYPASECLGLQVPQKGIELREHDDTFIRKDGSFFPVVFSASPLRKNGTTVGIVVGFRDDTERRRAEQAVRESEARFRLIANSAPVMIWMSDVDKQVTYVNQPWLDFTGWPSDVVPGHRWITLIHPDDVERCGDVYVNAFDQRKPFQVEHRLRRHDGEYRWTVTVGVPRYGTDRSFAGYVGTAVDVTERRMAEEALLEFHATLQERTLELERRTTQLSRMASDLTLAEQRAREELAKTLHDGLQQMLVVAAMNVESHIMRESQRGTPADDLVQAKNHLDEAIAAARSLSVELFPPVLQTSGLPTALGWLADWSRSKYGLEVKLSADSRANSDRKDVRTLLFGSVRELLFNVVKHAHVDRATVDLALGPNDTLCITVKDEGRGFDPMELDERTKGNQVGWGLFSIRERLTLLGGRFEIESAPGRGTTFRMIAPRDIAQRPVGASPYALRILIADDQPALRKTFRELLQARPEFQVVGEAASGLEAIAQAHVLRPDVVLMDVSMPEMDGVEATRRIRSELPFMQILGISVDPRMGEAIELAGAEDFFTKGIDTQRLVNHLLVKHASFLSGRDGQSAEGAP